MTPEKRAEIIEKDETLVAIAEHMPGEVARLKGELETANSRLAAYSARIDELSRFLHPATTGEVQDILGWVDARLGQYEESCPPFERGQLTLEALRTAPEKDCEDTAINVLATALREQMDTDCKRRSELAALRTRAEKAEQEACIQKDARKDMDRVAAEWAERAEKAEAERIALVSWLAYVLGGHNASPTNPGRLSMSVDIGNAEALARYFISEAKADERKARVQAQSRISSLEAALRPFAAVAATCKASDAQGLYCVNDDALNIILVVHGKAKCAPEFTVGDLRRAAAALWKGEK